MPLRPLVVRAAAEPLRTFRAMTSSAANDNAACRGTERVRWHGRVYRLLDIGTNGRATIEARVGGLTSCANPLLSELEPVCVRGMR